MSHTFVLKIEDGHTSWSLICPDDSSCAPAHICAHCGRSYDDTEIEACYDCSSQPKDPPGCWAQTWVGESMAEEVIHGTIEVAFPVHCQWNGEGLEAHVAGPVREHPNPVES